MRGEEEFDDSSESAWFVPVIVSEPRSDIDKGEHRVIVEEVRSRGWYGRHKVGDLARCKRPGMFGRHLRVAASGSCVAGRSLSLLSISSRVVDSDFLIEHAFSVFYGRPTTRCAQSSMSSMTAVVACGIRCD